MEGRFKTAVFHCQDFTLKKKIRQSAHRPVNIIRRKVVKRSFSRNINYFLDILVKDTLLMIRLVVLLTFGSLTSAFVNKFTGDG